MQKERWYVATKKADFNRIGEHFHISPVMARLMRNRDLASMDEMEQYLHGNLSSLHSPFALKDVKKGAAIIKEKIDQGKKIRIISDYDVDGVSSNYILYKGMTKCGAKVDYRIPDRIEDGYGINEHLIEQAKKDGIDTIITCDNGIAAYRQIEYGKSLGLTIVVTDHHDVPYDEAGNSVIPLADAVINPKQKDCGYPYESICGAVVAWKFIQVLFSLYDIPIEDSYEYLEIAAMATVCDVMPLKDENRIIVKEGLKRIGGTRITGLKALIDVNHLDEKEIKAFHFGFVLGPCINASGRLSTAREALELLLCDDLQTCLKKGNALKELNEERKEMTNDGVEEAFALIEEKNMEKDKVFVIYLPNCHESIAGIIAGRVKEAYHHPTFVLTKTKEGSVKGSGRSIEGYSMFDEMTKVKDCFTKYGGHPMAAGLSMEEDRVEELRQRLNENCSLTEDDFMPKVHIDLALPVGYITESFIRELDILEPFGTGNEKPLFAQKDLQILNMRVLGAAGRCVKFMVRNPEGAQIEALYFGEASKLVDEMKEFYGEDVLYNLSHGTMTKAAFHCTYYPQINEWNGNKTLQIVIKNIMFI